MVFVCSICTNSLNVRPANLLPNVKVELTATKCRHLFHTVCLGNWFDRQDAPTRQCPKCRALVSDVDTNIVDACGDDLEEADEERLLQQANRAAEELRELQLQNNQIYSLLVESGDNLGIEATKNDLLSREIEKLEDEIVELKKENAELSELFKVNENSFKTAFKKMRSEKKDYEENLKYAEAANVRLKMDFESQLQSKTQRIIDVETSANALRKELQFWIQECNRYRRREGLADGDQTMTNQITQTENPEMNNLDKRAGMYKECIEHMTSELSLLKKLTLPAAARAPCPAIMTQYSQSTNLNVNSTRLPVKLDPRANLNVKNGNNNCSIRIELTPSQREAAENDYRARFYAAFDLPPPTGSRGLDTETLDKMSNNGNGQSPNKIHPLPTVIGVGRGETKHFNNPMTNAGHKVVNPNANKETDIYPINWREKQPTSNFKEVTSGQSGALYLHGESGPNCGDEFDYTSGPQNRDVGHDIDNFDFLTPVLDGHFD